MQRKMWSEQNSQIKSSKRVEKKKDAIKKLTKRFNYSKEILKME